MVKVNRYFTKFLQKKVFLTLLIVLCCVVLSGCADVVNGSSEGYEERNASCWTCQFFGHVYRILGVVSQNTAPMLCSSAVTLMVVFLALWLAFYMGKNLIWGVEEPDYRTVWGTIIRTIAKATLVGIVLADVKVFYFVVNMIYIPIVELWMFFAMKILEVDLGTGTGALVDKLKTVEIGTEYASYEGVFPESLARQIETIIYAIQVAFDIGIGVGVSLLTTDFTGFLLAFFVMFSFFYLSLTFPLYFIDAVVRFGLAMIVMPLVFVAWVLPISGSKKIVSTFFKYIMGTGAQFLMASLFTAFSVSMVQTFLDQRLGISGTSAGQASASMAADMTMLKAPGLLLVTMCYYLMKLGERAPNIGATITETSSGETMMGSMISGVKKLAKEAVIAVVGLYSGGAATAISYADSAAQKAGDVASGGASGSE